MFPENDRAIAPPISQYARDVTWRFASDVRVGMNNLDLRLQAVERLPAAGRGRSFQFVPYRFQFANKLTKNDKLSLAFDAYVLSEAVGREVNLGKITYGDAHATLKVKLPSLVSQVRKTIKDITALLADNSPPDLVLNRHCGQCEFQARCRERATEKDELSLLSGMSEKERKRLHCRGIFTVTQLSYTFRPADAAEAREINRKNFIIHCERSQSARTKSTPSIFRTRNSTARRSIWMSKACPTAISTT